MLPDVYFILCILNNLFDLVNRYYAAQGKKVPTNEDDVSHSPIHIILETIKLLYNLAKGQMRRPF